MVAPHPKILWQTDKTPATVAFVNEAAVAYFTRFDLSDDARGKLGAFIAALVGGRESLTEAMTVDGWLSALSAPCAPQAAGALPPPELEWQIGKTVATIDFVRAAEAAFLTRTGMAEREARLLRAYVDRLKSGQLVLNEAMTLDGWIDRLRGGHY